MNDYCRSSRILWLFAGVMLLGLVGCSPRFQPYLPQEVIQTEQYVYKSLRFDARYSAAIRQGPPFSAATARENAVRWQFERLYMERYQQRAWGTVNPRPDSTGPVGAAGAVPGSYRIFASRAARHADIRQMLDSLDALPPLPFATAPDPAASNLAAAAVAAPLQATNFPARQCQQSRLRMPGTFYGVQLPDWWVRACYRTLDTTGTLADEEPVYYVWPTKISPRLSQMQTDSVGQVMNLRGRALDFQLATTAVFEEEAAADSIRAHYQSLSPGQKRALVSSGQYKEPEPDYRMRIYINFSVLGRINPDVYPPLQVGYQLIQ